MKRPVPCLRLKAENTLGVGRNATPSEIRKAWKNLAFEKHPDHGFGTDAEFSEINNAYAYLKNLGAAKADAATTAADTAPMPQPARARPTAKTRIVDLQDEAETTCRKFFEDAPGSTEADSTDHIPYMLRQKRRRVSYVVKTPLSDGVNRVAVPTGLSVDSRKVVPTILEMGAKDTDSSVFSVPKDIRSSLFPGAKSVRIHFDDSEE